jgi:diguanylate cyclase (GGDEF)-like protein
MRVIRHIKGSSFNVRFGWAVFGLAALLTAIFIVHATTDGGSPMLGSAVGRGVNATVGLLCAAVCFSRRRGSDGLPWLLIGAGIGSWALGNAYFTYFVGDLNPIPVPSPADPLWLAFYPLVYAGVMMLGRRRFRHLGAALWLDGLIGALAVASISATLVIDLVLRANGDQGFGAVAINLAYPIGDVVLILLLVGLVVTGPMRFSRSLAAASLGLVVFAISDTVYLAQSAAGTYAVGGLLDAGWLVGMLAVAYASLVWEPLGERASDRVRLGAPLAAPALSGLAALTVLVVQAVTERQQLGMLLAAGALLLVIVRMTTSMLRNRSMLDALHRESVTDALTGLGNRRRLFSDLPGAAARSSSERPMAVIIFDLDGFKTYNDTYGHAAGDRLLTRIGKRLQSDVAGSGAAYRLGGDEFCALVDVHDRDPQQIAARLAGDLAQSGQGFVVTASFGCAIAPVDGRDTSELMRRADRRMYEEKNSRRPSAATQATDALLALVHERYPDLDDHTSGVAVLARRVAERLQLNSAETDATACAAALHDVGKIAIPDEILNKPGPLDDQEWELMRRHTEIGERVLRSVPALRAAAPLVRWSHERWDGGGYPDALTGNEIPIGASIVAACDSYDAMTEERCYQASKTSAEALAELQRCSGTHFRPEVVDALRAVLEMPAATDPRAAAPRRASLDVSPLMTGRPPSLCAGG